VTEEQKRNNQLLTIEQTRLLADETINDDLIWKNPIDICAKSKPYENIHELFSKEERKQYK